MVTASVARASCAPRSWHHQASDVHSSDGGHEKLPGDLHEAGKGKTKIKKPLSLGMRWPVERTNSWLSNFGQLGRNTDRFIAQRLGQVACDVVEGVPLGSVSEVGERDEVIVDGDRCHRTQLAGSRRRAGCAAARLVEGEGQHCADVRRSGLAVLTPRLEVRPAAEKDRARFVELFCDEDFMIFYAGALTTIAAHARFDEMLVRCAELDFAKQPVIERSTGVILGYSGVDWFDLDGRRHLEYGYRLVPQARGKGYATEASAALLAKASESFSGEVLAIIDPTNHPSQNVIRKLDFDFWKESVVDTCLRNIYRRRIDPAVPSRS